MDRRLLLIAVIAAAVRLAAVLAILAHPWQGAIYQNDSDEYMAMGRALAGGDLLFTGVPWQPLFRTPGYPIFLALFYALGMPDLQVALVQALLDACSCILIFRMAESALQDRSAALAASALYALNPLFLAYSFQLLSETLFLFVFIIANIVFLSGLREKGFGRGRAALLGAAFGLMIWIKPSALLLPLIYSAVLRLKGGSLRDIGLLLAIPAAFALAWAGRNYVIEGEPVLSATALWNVVCYYAGDIAMTPGADLSGHELTIERFRLYDPASCTDLPYPELREGLYPALDLIGRNLPLFALHTLRGGILLFDPFNPAGHIGSALSGIPSYGIERLMLSGGEGFQWFLPIYVYAFAYQACLYAFAAFHLRKGEARGEALFMIFAMLLAYSILLNGPLGYARYRFPLEPFLILFAASGMLEATGRYRRSPSSRG